MMLKFRMLFILVVLALVAGSQSAIAAVAIEASCIGVGGCTLAPAGQNRVIYALVSDDVAIVQDFTCTFNGTNFDNGGAPLAETTGTGQYLSVYRFTNPAATSASVTCTGADIVAAIALSGVDQTTPDDGIPAAAETAGADPVTSPSVSSTAGDLVVGGVSINAKAVANVTPTGTNQVQQQELDLAGSHYADLSTTSGTTPVTQSWDLNSAARASAFVFNVNAGGPVTPWRRLMMGIGQ